MGNAVKGNTDYRIYSTNHRHGGPSDDWWLAEAAWQPSPPLVRPAFNKATCVVFYDDPLFISRRPAIPSRGRAQYEETNKCSIHWIEASLAGVRRFRGLHPSAWGEFHGRRNEEAQYRGGVGGLIKSEPTWGGCVVGCRYRLRTSQPAWTRALSCLSVGPSQCLSFLF